MGSLRVKGDGSLAGRSGQSEQVASGSTVKTGAARTSGSGVGHSLLMGGAGSGPSGRLLGESSSGKARPPPAGSAGFTFPGPILANIAGGAAVQVGGELVLEVNASLGDGLESPLWEDDAGFSRSITSSTSANAQRVFDVISLCNASDRKDKGLAEDDSTSRGLHNALGWTVIQRRRGRGGGSLASSRDGHPPRQTPLADNPRSQQARTDQSLLRECMT